MIFFTRSYWIVMSTFLLSSCFSDVEVVNSQLQWIEIEGSSFQMGSEKKYSNEQPVHTVTVPTFEITQTEVSVAQYQACVEVGACSDPHKKSTYFKNGFKDHPVTHVDWDQARTFAQWVGGDLPSEAQWEYAARGGEGNQYEYAGSNTIDDVAWYILNTNSDESRPVGQKQANGYGLYDMSGNVGEWVLDEYEESYEGAPTDGSPRCSSRNCIGSSERVIRGGNWRSGIPGVRVTYRDKLNPSYHSLVLGFRVVRSPNKER